MHENLVVHPAEFWAANETIAKIHKRKLCIAAGRGDCAGGIVEAHTIPRSQLGQIAQDGHVYHMLATAGDLLKNDGRYKVDKRGIGEFSVLNFFCAKHDREIFTHVEKDDLEFDRHQLSLLHYRAMGAELYKKMNALEGSRFHLDRLKKQRRNKEQMRFLESLAAGQVLGLRDMTRTFTACEIILRDQRYDRIDGVVIRFHKMPTIMSVGGFSPEFDYDGLTLQRLGRVDSVYEQISLSILAAQGRAALVFAWISNADVCRQFVQSFLAQKPELFATLAVQTTFEHLENTCMNISWWDSLSEVERQALLTRMQFAGSPFQERTARCLQYCGITFDQWDYDGHFFVDAP